MTDQFPSPYKVKYSQSFRSG